MKTKLIYAITILSALATIPSAMAANGAIVPTQLPDGGSTLWLLGIALTGLVTLFRKRMGKSS